MSTSPRRRSPRLREVRTRLRRPSFFVFTGLLVVAILASGILARVLNDDSRPSYDVGTVGTIPELFGPALDVSVRAGRHHRRCPLVRRPRRRGAGTRGRRRSTRWSTATPNRSPGTATPRATRSRPCSTSRGAPHRPPTRRPRPVSTTPRWSAILDPPPLQSDVIDPDDEPGVGLLVGFASAVLLFISITTSGAMS